MTPRLWDLLARAIDGERLSPPERTEARRLLGHRPPAHDLFPSAPRYCAPPIAREECPAAWRTADAAPLDGLNVDPFHQLGPRGA